MAPREPTPLEIVAKLRQDARDIREILAAWPQNSIGNINYQMFQRDAEMWDSAADLVEEFLAHARARENTPRA